MLTYAIILAFVVFMAWPLVRKVQSLRRDLAARKELIEAQRRDGGTPPA
jgi:flagellar biogenesis protein FliO